MGNEKLQQQESPDLGLNLDMKAFDVIKNNKDAQKFFSTALKTSFNNLPADDAEDINTKLSEKQTKAVAKLNKLDTKIQKLEEKKTNASENKKARLEKRIKNKEDKKDKIEIKNDVLSTADQSAEEAAEALKSQIETEIKNLDTAYQAYDKTNYSIDKYPDITAAKEAGVIAINKATTPDEATQAETDAVTKMSEVADITKRVDKPTITAATADERATKFHVSEADADGKHEPLPGYTWVDENNMDNLATKEITDETVYLKKDIITDAAKAGKDIGTLYHLQKDETITETDGYKPLPGYTWVDENDMKNYAVKEIPLETLKTNLTDFSTTFEQSATKSKLYSWILASDYQTLFDAIVATEDKDKIVAAQAYMRALVDGDGSVNGANPDNDGKPGINTFKAVCDALGQTDIWTTVQARLIAEKAAAKAAADKANSANKGYHTPSWLWLNNNPKISPQR